MKSLTQGQQVDADSIKQFVSQLTIDENDKQTLLKLTPADYTGFAPKLVEMI
jgi:adenylosuccinate lyase